MGIQKSVMVTKLIFNLLNKAASQLSLTINMYGQDCFWWEFNLIPIKSNFIYLFNEQNLNMSLYTGLVLF